MLKRIIRVISLTALLAISFTVCLSPALSQSLSRHDRETGRIMLRNVKDLVKKNYYDPKYHGVDIDATFSAADEQIKNATSNGQIFGIIAKALNSLNDTHTFFLPPPHAMRVSYDWQIQMIGDRCYILAVKPGTDAEAKGLKPGDILHVVDGYKITNENFWLFNYLYNALQPKTDLSLVVQGPGEQPRRVDYTASSRQGKKVLDLTSEIEFYDFLRERQELDRIYEHRFRGVGKELYIWKMPQFDLEAGRIHEVIRDAGDYKTLILDLRDNGGGYVDTLRQLVSTLFDRDVKIGDRKERKETKELMVKTRGRDVFKGQLIVLVDRGSASASEILSRVVQLEKRGIVIGDVTAGSVMQSRRHSLSLGESSLVLYGASITNADIIMTDGKSLEHTGVTPDKIMLPTGADLRAQADPVLSYAASLAGVELDPKEAGALFPIRWKLKP